MDLVLFLRLGCPVQGVRLRLHITQRLVRRLILDLHFPILVDEDLPEERLIAQSPVLVVAPAVDQRDVREQRQAVIEVGSGCRVLVVMRRQPPLDVIEPGLDPHLLFLE
ncbi:MAG: hypothetical protein ACTH93_03755 [Pseudoclavibacter sp.]